MMSLAIEGSQLVVNPPTTYRRGRHRRIRLISENSPRRLVPQTGVFTARVLRRWRRDKATMFESLIMPTVLLVTLDIVLGDGVTQASGHDALYGTVPLIALVGVMDGAMVSGIGLMRERTDGLLSRLWVLPVHRASGLASRLAADVVRIVVTTAVLLCAGLVMGFRFRQGPVASVAWLLVPIALGLAFSATVIVISLYAPSTVVVQATEIIWAVLMFFCTGFAPLDQYPHWLQPVIHHQPVSCAVDAMLGLSLGGPVFAPLLEMLFWAAGIAGVCAIPLAFGYRKASMRG
jgi:ABC-2 type transport system permease protein